ncbi:TetR/AcrR family transcriptional regulator [Mycobacterium sp. OTB74]|uniref:TetR/AcrR family transcriptional regulator n=1 Tax=Mycobacterium sp. OTB74 TaxID=1853452 RepID=UPI00247566C0|nr:TetR/AcrR family transcriptional regulator [Mycobacterium sp. OTB74]
MTRSRALILDAAGQVFIELGYQGATVEQVAARAGVVKRTIYNLYNDKEALFRATVLQSISIAERFSADLATDVRAVAEPLAELPAIAVRLAEAVLLTRVLPLRRLLVMESSRFPDLVAQYRNRAPEAVMRALADLFGSLADRGLLRPNDPSLAAEHFAFLVMGADLDRGMFIPEIDQTRIRERAVAGAAAFLRAYAA